MKLLTTAAGINEELLRLIKVCSSCYIAVAWASVGFPVFDLLKTVKRKIKRMIVGTHFCQTRPEFIEEFLDDHLKVGFILQSDHLFHPKVYLFDKTEGEWELIVGSPNFSRAATSSNDEIAVLLSNHDDGASDIRERILSAIDGYWRRAKHLNRDELESYRRIWKRKRRSVRQLGDETGLPKGTRVNVDSMQRYVTRLFGETCLDLLETYGPMTYEQICPHIKKRHPDLCDDNDRRYHQGRDMKSKWHHWLSSALSNRCRKRRNPPITYDKASRLYARR
jgi:HKD family nuclease